MDKHQLLRVFMTLIFISMACLPGCSTPEAVVPAQTLVLTAASIPELTPTPVRTTDAPSLPAPTSTLAPTTTETPVPPPSITPAPSHTATPNFAPTRPAVATCPSALPSRLLPGDVAQVANMQLPLRVRQEIGLEALVLGLARQSYQVVIQEGPLCADDLAWYRVRTQFGLEGWVAEGDDQDYFLNQISQESLITAGFNLAYESNGTVFLFNESRGTIQTLMQLDQAISTPPEWSWSPDGLSLLFFKLVDEKIAGFVYDLQSGQERRLTDHFGFVSWHPGGEVIAFSDNTKYKLINLSDGSEAFRVFVRAAYESSFSPDGSQLAVAVYTGSQYELHALDVSRDSFGAWTLEPLSAQTQLDAGNVYYNIRWSPSGDKIAYVQSDGSEFSNRLKVMDLEANRVEDISPGDGQVYQQVVWAPDGDRLAFLALTPVQPGQPFRFEVYLSTTRRGGFQAKVFDFQDVTVTTPSWAPDGSRLVFTIFSDTLPPRLYVANSDGSYATPFILSDSQAYNAQFQP